MLSRISWSSDGSRSMRCNDDLTRGFWAGDRFHILTLESVEGGDNAGWKDGSEKAAKKTRDLKESNITLLQLSENALDLCIHSERNIASVAL